MQSIIQDCIVGAWQFLFQSSRKHSTGTCIGACGSTTSENLKSVVRSFYKEIKHKNRLGNETEDNI